MINKAERDLLMKLRPHLRSHGYDFALAAFSMAVVAALSSVSMGLVKLIVDQIFIDKDIRMLEDLAWIVPILFLIKGVFSYILNYKMTKIGHSAARSVRSHLIERVIFQDHAFHSRNHSADILARATNDAASVTVMISNTPLFVLRDGLTVVFLMGLIFYLNTRFALVMLATVPVFASIFGGFTKKLRRVSALAQEMIAELYRIISEAIAGLPAIKVFLYERPWLARFDAKNHDHYQAMLKFQRITALSPSLMEFLSGIVISAVLLSGGLAVIRGFWSAGDFFAFLGASFSAYMPIKHLAQVNPMIQMGLAGWRRILEVLESPQGIRVNGHPKESPVYTPGLAVSSSAMGLSFSRSISYEDVGLAYPDGRRALQEINLSLNKGEVLGLAGPSGSGKSTLAALLARFYDPTEGRVALDGIDIRLFDVHQLRRLLAFVTQDAFLFQDTIEANIAMGRPGCSPADIERAAASAHAAEFISRLPRGLNTRIGERGLLLSAGQRQRIAIARAMLKDPEILVFDEATSNLDPESEQVILGSLHELIRGKTAIIISHRIAALENTDRILFIEQGRIAQETSYEVLVRDRTGRMAALFNLTA